MTARAHTPQTTRAGDDAARFVGRTVSRLQHDLLEKTHAQAAARATLARLRRGVGRPVGDVPDLLEFTVAPQTSPVHGDAPSIDEIAVHTALTLYSLHQQSQSQPMHTPSRSFASAVGTLRFRSVRPGDDEVPGITRRFQGLATATDFAELVQHARGLITLLRGSGVGFDYQRFTRDLVRLQLPTWADNTRLSWGRDFYRVTTTDPNSEENS